MTIYSPEKDLKRDEVISDRWVDGMHLLTVTNFAAGIMKTTVGAYTISWNWVAA